jgi:hypothetical protein
LSFQIVPLAADAIAEFVQLDDAALAERHAFRLTADAPSSYPCRVSLRYAERGDPLLLLNYARHGCYACRVDRAPAAGAQ